MFELEEVVMGVDAHIVRIVYGSIGVFITIVLTITGVLLARFLRSVDKLEGKIESSIAELNKNLSAISEKLSLSAIDLAKNYVTKEDHRNSIRHIYSRIEGVEDVLKGACMKDDCPVRTDKR